MWPKWPWHRRSDQLDCVNRRCQLSYNFQERKPSHVRLNGSFLGVIESRCIVAPRALKHA